jgi:hypothetical protein
VTQQIIDRSRWICGTVALQAIQQPGGGLQIRPEQKWDLL